MCYGIFWTAKLHVLVINSLIQTILLLNFKAPLAEIHSSINNPLTTPMYSFDNDLVGKCNPFIIIASLKNNGVYTLLSGIVLDIIYPINKVSHL